MAKPLIPESLIGHRFSASELKGISQWPGPLVEEFLSLFDNFILISDVINQKQDLLRTVVSVTFADSPYNIVDIDQIIDFDTTDGDIVANLPDGVGGRYYRMTDVATTGNKVVLNPSGDELLFGQNSSENIYNAETLIMIFKDPQGWW